MSGPPKKPTAWRKAKGNRVSGLGTMLSRSHVRAHPIVRNT